MKNRSGRFGAHRSEYRRAVTDVARDLSHAWIRRRGAKRGIEQDDLGDRFRRVRRAGERAVVEQFLAKQ